MNGWIGVDLDGTLAQYDGWVHELHIGDPVPAMAQRVRNWLALGYEVRIFTARVCEPDTVAGDRARASVADIRSAIQDWTEKHIGLRLPVTNIKDFGMVQLWDDRAVRVVANKGEPCCSLQPEIAWLPIETAPRDGTVIELRWGEDGYSPGWWNRNKPTAIPEYPWSFIDFNNSNAFINSARDLEGYGPSHWRPYSAGSANKGEPCCSHSEDGL